MLSPLLLGLFAVAPAPAQTLSPAPAAAAAVVMKDGSAKNAQGDADEVEVAPDSPRAAVRNFLELSAAGKDTEAAAYLQLEAPLSNEGGAELARKLSAVLESEPTFDVDKISGDTNGDTTDGLRPLHDKVGAVHMGRNTVEPIRMLKPDAAAEWQFTPFTVRRVPGWYDALPSAWVQKNLPKWAVKRGPAGLHLWQWGGLSLLVLLSWLVGFVLSRIISKVATRLVKKTKNTWDDKLLEMAEGPLTLAASLGVGALALSWLDLPEAANALTMHLVKGGFLAVFFWVCLKAVDVARELLGRAKFANDRPASRSLLSLGARFTKAALFVVLVIAVLSSLGLPVGSLLAGLGIGGLAVALAGQKTLENLIGTFAIAIDHPFREGDWVHIRDFSGTVEAIGLRSTRFRTAERTIITLPNGKLADEQIETYAARDRFHLFATLGVRYGSKPDQLKAAVAKIEADLKSKWPKIDTTTVNVHLANLKEWSASIELEAMVNTTDANEFATLKQEVLLHVMSVLESGGLRLQPMELVSNPQKLVG